MWKDHSNRALFVEWKTRFLATAGLAASHPLSFDPVTLELAQVVAETWSWGHAETHSDAPSERYMYASCLGTLWNMLHLRGAVGTRIMGAEWKEFRGKESQASVLGCIY